MSDINKIEGTTATLTDGGTILAQVKSVQEEILNLGLAKSAKKAVRRDDLPSGTQNKLASLPEESRAKVSGVAGRKSVEPQIMYIRAQSEHVIKNDNGSFIVLGRDRVRGRKSGYGGEGHTQCAAIDMVVGRGGSDVSYLGSDGKSLYTDPDFQKDAARIYISQKADIDDYLLLGETGLVQDPPAKGGSAVALVADDIRVVSRSSIRLVTMMGGNSSKGGANDTVGGITLVANNDTSDIQPLVKGKNLVAALKELVDLIDDMRSIMVENTDSQMQFNNSMMQHTHLSPFFGMESSPSGQLLTATPMYNVQLFEKTLMSLKNTGLNLSLFEKDYLAQWAAPAGSTQSKWILSKFNTTN
jgi:hypothetical protein